jgi:two-component system OmpR family response regulator
METMATLNQIENIMENDRLKVLVFDEDPAQLDALCMALALYNYDCLKADNNAEAFEHLYETDAKSVDLVVIDLSAPKQIGLEAVRLCHLARPDVPIVILAGLKSTEAIRYARTMGFPILNKPFDPDELDGLLKRISQTTSQKDPKQ